jgi:hypothetical protein
MHKYIVFWPSALAGHIAGARIAKWIAAQLGKQALLIDGKGCAAVGATELAQATLFIVMPQKTMVGDIPGAERLVRHAKQVVCVHNDYTVWVPTSAVNAGSMFFKPFTERVRSGAPLQVWTTCENRTPDPLFRYIDWNAIIGTADKSRAALYTPLGKRTEDVYWGAHREHRAGSFVQYLGAGTHLRLSTSPKNLEKFQAAYGFDGVHEHIKDLSELTKYSGTVYIEDKISLRQYHSLANRFHEALTAGLCLFVHASAVPTFTKAGLIVPNELRVECAADMAAMSTLWRNKWRKWQADNWLHNSAGVPHELATLARFKALCRCLK